MKQPPVLNLYWFGSLLLVIILTGCTFGGRRASINHQPTQNQSQPSVPAATMSEIMPAATAAENGEILAIEKQNPIQNQPQQFPTTTPAATTENGPESTGDEQGQKLIDQLNALDTANQAGDPLDDLP